MISPTPACGRPGNGRSGHISGNQGKASIPGYGKRCAQSGRQAGNAVSVSPSEGNLRRLQSREGSWLKLFSLKQHQNNLLTQRVKRTGAKRSNFFYNMSFSVSGSSAANSFSLDWETKADSQCSTLFPSFQHLWPPWKRSESPGDQKKAPSKHGQRPAHQRISALISG